MPMSHFVRCLLSVGRHPRPVAQVRGDLPHFDPALLVIFGVSSETPGPLGQCPRPAMV